MHETARKRRDLVMKFESLGGNGHGAEFAIFQQHSGAEPAGLLAWADLGADLLRRALESRFDGVGLDENTIVFTPDHSDEWWSKDKRYWMAMRSFIKTDGVSPEQAASDICRRHQSLRPKLIDDLEGGEKIFVFKDIHRNLTGAEIDRLHAAVRAYGDLTLFYVRYADETHPPGTVQASAPGLLIGYIDHFAFSPDNKPIGLSDGSWLTLCERAAWLHRQQPIEPAASEDDAPRTEHPADAAPLARPRAKVRRGRQIVLIGNCQMQAMAGLHKRFVAGRSGDILEHVPSYQDLSDQHRAAIQRADLVVEQLFDLKQNADTEAVPTTTPRIFIPMVTAAFLWPFAGSPHPKNTFHPFLAGGPYGGEAAEFLSQPAHPGRHRSGRSRRDLREPGRQQPRQSQPPVRNRHGPAALPRRGGRLPDRRPHGAALPHRTDIPQPLPPQCPHRDRPRQPVLRATGRRARRNRPHARLHADHAVPQGRTPVPPKRLPPLRVDFVTPDRRYRFMNEGTFTFREYALRYMRYEWNDALEEGMYLSQTGKLDEARERLTVSIQRSPLAAAAYNALSHVLNHQGARDEAVAAQRRAVALEPDAASYRANLGNLLRQERQLDEALTELQSAVADDPAEPHYRVLLSHLLRQRGDLDAA